MSDQNHGPLTAAYLRALDELQAVGWTQLGLMRELRTVRARLRTAGQPDADPALLDQALDALDALGKKIANRHAERARLAVAVAEAFAPAWEAWQQGTEEAPPDRGLSLRSLSDQLDAGIQDLNQQTGMTDTDEGRNIE
jgi:hypothetical protein